jgi:hypothetical protein
LHRTKSSNDVFFNRESVFTYLNGRDVFLKERADRELFSGIGGETPESGPGNRKRGWKDDGETKGQATEWKVRDRATGKRRRSETKAIGNELEATGQGHR